MIRVELVKLVRRPRTWVGLVLLCGLPIAGRGVRSRCTDLAPRPARARPSCPRCCPTARCYPAAALAIVLPFFLPVAVAVVGRRRDRRRGQAGTLRYLLARPVGRTRLLVAKLVALIVFVLLAVVVVAVVGYVDRASLLFGAPRRPRPAPTR